MNNARVLSSDEADRRSHKRFPIERILSYKLAKGRTWSEAMLGQTVNISSDGILFQGQTPLNPGKRLELAISWPVQLDGKCGLKLVAKGYVVRSRGSAVAVRVEKYEFHTQSSRSLLVNAGLSSFQHAAAAGMAV